MPYAPRTPASADPTHVGLSIAFCGTVTLLVLYENYEDLSSALVAFAAAYFIVFRIESHEQGESHGSGNPHREGGRTID